RAATCRPHIPTGRRDHERNHETDTADVIRGNFGEPWSAISGDSGGPAGTPPFHRPGVGPVLVGAEGDPDAGKKLRPPPIDGIDAGGIGGGGGQEALPHHWQDGGGIRDCGGGVSKMSGLENFLLYLLHETT